MSEPYNRDEFMMMRPKPKLAVWKFASCDGCQLSLLDCADDLLALAGLVDIAYFPEASSAMMDGPYDLSLVEGSITTPADADRIHRIRQESAYLVAIGACATAGGIQALRNYRDLDELVNMVYARPAYIDSLATSTPISQHVSVDFELQGCPINKRQLIEVIRSFLQGQAPRMPAHSVCVECKRRGIACLTVTRGIPCLGPITHAGCGALCPAYRRGCYGCYGPNEQPATSVLRARLLRQGMAPADVVRSFRTFNAAAPAFEQESRAVEEVEYGGGGV